MPARKGATKKAAPVAVVEPDEDDVEELDDADELEDEADEDAAEETEEKPKRKKIEYGSAWLAELVNEKLGTEHSAYTIRALIRKMIKDDSVDDKFERTVGEDRERYEFTGEKDPKVRAVLAYVKKAKSAPKKDASDNLAKARAAKVAKAKAKAAEEVVEEDDAEDLDDDDDEDVDDLD